MCKYVVKRNGNIEEFNVKKIKRQIEFVTKNTSISPIVFETKFNAFLPEKVKTSEIQNLLLHTAITNISVDEPDWDLVGGRLAMWDIYGTVYKNTGIKFSNWKKLIEYLTNKGYYKPEVLEKLNKFNITEEDINYGDWKNIDLKHPDFNKVTRQSIIDGKRYVIRNINGPIEYPFMIDIANAVLLANDREDFFVKYTLLSKGYISLATPFRRNLRLVNGNTGSCFIGGTGDNLASITKSWQDISVILKKGGGVGWDVSKLRPMGTYSPAIVKSNNIVTWNKIYNDIVIAVDQAGVRKGALTLGLRWFHLDLQDMIEARVETKTDMRNKTFDIFPQVVLDNYFVKKYFDNDYVYQFNHYYYKKLTGVDVTELVGEKLHKELARAEELCKTGKLTHYRKIRARDLFAKILWHWIEIGQMYISNVDNLNKSNYVKHKYITSMSNLCVAPETKILTRDGYKVISELEDQYVDVWNGEEWSRVKVIKTGENQKLIKVKTTGGELECTEYHKFYVEENGGIVEKRAWELKPNDELIRFTMPDEDEVRAYKVIEIIDEGRVDDTYCFTEPKRHMGVFNGLLTGQCTESFSIVKPATKWVTKCEDEDLKTIETDGIYHSCNLISINLVKSFTDNDLGIKYEDVVYQAVDMLDRSIDLTTNPVKEAENGSKLLRNIGIGFLGLADVMAYNNKTYDNEEGRRFGASIAEKTTYYAYKASVKLAKERGSYPMYNEANYDTLLGEDVHYLDKMSSEYTGNNFKWSELQKEIKEYGIRNFLLTAVAPNTSTSLVMGVSASYLPVFNKFYYETLADIQVPILPKYIKEKYWYYKTRYQYKTEDIIRFTRALQLWIDTGISMELNMNPNLSTIVDIADAIMEGFLKGDLKAVYYSTTLDKEDNKKDSKEVCLDCAN